MMLSAGKGVTPAPNRRASTQQAPSPPQGMCKPALPRQHAHSRSMIRMTVLKQQGDRSQAPGSSEDYKIHDGLEAAVQAISGLVQSSPWFKPTAPVKSQPATQVDHKATAAWTVVERKPLAGGYLELVRWEAAPSQRLLRVWVPPGYYQEGVPTDQDGAQRVAAKANGPPTLVHSEPPEGGWPVFYLNDAQNLYDDKQSFSGHSWRAAQTAEQLIRSGDLPPFIIVGMDHAGSQRSYEYTPYKPGTGPGGWRQDAACWPGGGVWQYIERVVNEVMPWAQRTYGATSNPSRVGFGGSSFGGICTLCMSMKYPHLFESALVESPSLWINNEHFLRKDIVQYKGKWPERMWVGMGTAEYKGDGQQLFSRMLGGYYDALMLILQNQGMELDDGLKGCVAPHATHSEKAWAERLPRALRHACLHWKPPPSQ